MIRPQVTIYTDGGCEPNPGTGGFGVVMIFEDRVEEFSGGAEETTNNQMELIAAITALEALPQPYNVTLFTDSQYVKNGIESWLKTWVKNNWRTASRQPVKNQDLWQRLHQATQRHNITWQWVRGHAGNHYNEKVDQLAAAEIARLKGKPVPAPIADKSAQESAPESDIQVYLTALYNFDLRQGGWRALIVTLAGEKELGGKESHSSENQLLLTGLVAALQSLPKGKKAAVYTQSEYIQKGMTAWMKGWIKNGWRTAKGDPVKNRELWEAAHQAAQRCELRWPPVSTPADQTRMTALLQRIRATLA